MMVAANIVQKISKRIGRVPWLLAASISSLSFLIILIISLPVSLMFINQGFLKLESIEVNENNSRTIQVIDKERVDLEQFLQDYAEWDDTYHFMFHNDSEYLDNFDNTLLEDFSINMLALYNPQSELVAFQGFDYVNSEKVNLPFTANDLKRDIPSIFRFNDISDSHLGFFSIEGRIMMIASQPILKTNGQGPSAGIFIVGRFLDGPNTAHIAKLAQLDVNFYPISGNTPPLVNQAKQSLLADPQTGVVVIPVNDRLVAGYSMLKDPDGVPVAILETVHNRFIMDYGNGFKTSFTVSFISIASLAFALVFLAFYHISKTHHAIGQRINRYQSVVDQAKEAVLFLDLSNGTIIDANLSGQSILDINPSTDKPARIMDVIRNGFDLHRMVEHIGDFMEMEWILASGKEIQVEAYLTQSLDMEKKEYTAILFRDISGHKQIENDLRASEERYELAIKGANDGLWDWNLVSDNIFYSERWKNMLGFSQSEIGNSPDEWLDRVHPDELWALRSAISYHLRQETEYLYFEHRMRMKDGSYRWMLARGVAYFKDGYAIRMAGSQTDITERKVIEDQIKFDALHDMLTGLANRALLKDRIKQAARRCKRHDVKDYALLLLDLDRFKRVNDNLGHGTGDQLLIEVSHRVQACLRTMDTIARVSSDEFVILLEETKDFNEVIKVTERVLHSFDQAFLIDGREINLTTSIGVVIPEDDYEDIDEVIRYADIAMNAAKESGRGRYIIFTREMHRESVIRMDLENELRRALELKEFQVYYQPIYSLEHDQMISLEALVRWKHPKRGLLAPGEFINVAEETGLIIPMGLWVLRQACKQLKDWHNRLPQRAPLSISVNLSARQFSHENLFEEIQNILIESGLEPHWLWLEVTESVLVQDIKSATSTLQRLRQLGVRIEIDDFGTGYSSLSYLQQLPVDGIKIDRSFVNTIHVNENDRKIVRTIIDLCHSLGITEVAEGIETIDHKEHLKQLGCWYGQGYLYSRPVEDVKVEAMLEELTNININNN